MLFRASAYRRNGLDAEAIVFFEARDYDSASARLLRLLALAWDCPAAEVEFYNLESEAEMRADSCAADAGGEARLLQIGWGGDEGALFASPQRTLVLGTPRVQARLFTAFICAEQSRARRAASRARRCAAAPAAVC